MSLAPSLEEVQQWMLDALIFPRRVNPAAIRQHLESSPRLDAAERLAVYQRSYYLRLLECMSDQFPALCHALGKDLFRDFSRRYLQDCPSQSYTLYALGERFADYLERTRPDRDAPQEGREGWIDFMVDLARYEYSLFTMFDAPGNEGKPWAKAEMDDSLLVLQPCFALHSFGYPVAAYYHQVRHCSAAQLPPREQSFVAIARRDYQIHTYPITHIHFLFLTALTEGRRVADALSHVSAVAGRPIEEVHRSWRQQVRQRWIETGFFVERQDENDTPRTEGNSSRVVGEDQRVNG